MNNCLQGDLFATSPLPIGRNLKISTKDSEFIITPWWDGLRVFCVKANTFLEESKLELFSIDQKDWYYSQYKLRPKLEIPQSIWEKGLIFGELKLVWFMLIIRIPEFRDYYEHDPFLTAILCEQWKNGMISEEEIRLGLKQKRDLWLKKLFGISNTKTALKLIRKIKLRAFDSESTYQLESILISPTIQKTLVRLPEIQNDIFQFLVQYADTPDLLADITQLLLSKNRLDKSKIEKLNTYHQLIKDNPLCLRFCHSKSGLETLEYFLPELSSHGEQEWHQAWQETRTLKQLEELHLRISLTWSEFLLDQMALDEPYPEPPFLNGNNIRPIKSPKELQDYGRQLLLCIAAYHEEVKSGYSYFYFVNSKKSAVIELRKLDQGTDLWFLSEMRARANKPPCPESVEMVKAWLKENESLISIKNCQFPSQKVQVKSNDEDINEFDEIIDEYFKEKDWAQDELLCSETRNEMIFPDDFDEC